MTPSIRRPRAENPDSPSHPHNGRPESPSSHKQLSDADKKKAEMLGLPVPGDASNSPFADNGTKVANDPVWSNTLHPAPTETWSPTISGKPVDPQVGGLYPGLVDKSSGPNPILENNQKLRNDSSGSAYQQADPLWSTIAQKQSDGQPDSPARRDAYSNLFHTDSEYSRVQLDHDLQLITHGPSGERTQDFRDASARLNAHYNARALWNPTNGTYLIDSGYTPSQLVADLALNSSTAMLDDDRAAERNRAKQRINAHHYGIQNYARDQEDAALLPYPGWQWRDGTPYRVDPGPARERLSRAGLGVDPRYAYDYYTAQHLGDPSDPQAYNPRYSSFDKNPHAHPMPVPEPDYKPGISDVIHGLASGFTQPIQDLGDAIDEGDFWKGAKAAGETGLLFLGPDVAPALAERAGLAAGTAAADRAATAGLGDAVQTSGAGAGFRRPWDTNPRTPLDDPAVGGASVRWRKNSPDATHTDVRPSIGDDAANNGVASIPTKPRTRQGGGALDPAGIGGPTIDDPRFDPLNQKGWKPKNRMPRRGPGVADHEHGFAGRGQGRTGDSDIVGQNPDDYRLPWSGETVDTPEGYWPWGVFEGKNGQWYRRMLDGTTRKPAMPEWAKGSKTIDSRAIKGDRTTFEVQQLLTPHQDGLVLTPDLLDSMNTAFRLNEVDAMQRAAMASRDATRIELGNQIRGMKLEDEDGQLRQVTLDDLTDSDLRSTILNLRASGKYDKNSIKKVEQAAQKLIDEKGSISALSDVRGQVGADYAGKRLNIETIYQGAGNFDSDRIGIQTLPDGTKRVVLIEEKGGLRPSLSTRQVDVGSGKKINAEQGSVPYGVDEFRSDSRALQALVDYDATHGTRLAQDLVSGNSNFDYLLIHTEPGTNAITVTKFEPGAGQEFNLAYPGTGQKPPTLPIPTRPEVDSPLASSRAAGASPIAAAGLARRPDLVAPEWLSGLIASVGPGVGAIAKLARTRAIPVAGSLPHPFGLAAIRPADQSVTVNVKMQAATHRRSSDREQARFLTYALSIR